MLIQLRCRFSTIDRWLVKDAFVVLFVVFDGFENRGCLMYLSIANRSLHIVSLAICEQLFHALSILHRTLVGENKHRSGAEKQSALKRP
jgi:hypothetical protein